jgi:hypothetical protein
MLSDPITSRLHTRSNGGGVLKTALRHPLNGMIVQLTAHSPHANPVIYPERTPLPAHIPNETFFVNSFLHIKSPHELRNRRRYASSHGQIARLVLWIDGLTSFPRKYHEAAFIIKHQTHPSSDQW